MQISTQTPRRTAAKRNPLPSAEMKPESADQVTLGETPTVVKAGKFALAAGVAAGAGYVGYFAGTAGGGLATAAGVGAGLFAGAVAGGTVGLMADIGGMVGLSDSNHTKTGALVGGGLGAIVGGVVGATVQNPLVGTVIGVAAGAGGVLVTSMATNILAD